MNRWPQTKAQISIILSELNRAVKHYSLELAKVGFAEEYNNEELKIWATYLDVKANELLKMHKEIQESVKNEKSI